ncbi:hypothetical protein PMAYCL1PPCAC_08159, partial [Pristionchus mayeri]
TFFKVYFIFYSQVLGKFEFTTLWSLLFYGILFALGISTFFGLLETSISALTDQFKFARKHRVITILLLCFVGLGAGFVQCTRIGFLIFYILDVRVLPLMAQIMVGLQLLAIACYGPRNFYRDISASMGKKVNFFGYFVSPYGLVVRICQFVLSPVLIIYGTYRQWIGAEI